MLDNDSITFGKYNGKKLIEVLHDRDYSKWLLSQDWFENSYPHLYAKIQEYNPHEFFYDQNVSPADKNFIDSYTFFRLYEPDVVSSMVKLTSCEISCYTFYRDIIMGLRDSIHRKMQEGARNVYDIKTPTKWLKDFEEKHGIPRDDMKEFLARYELPSIAKIVETVKAQGGIEYKGATSWSIAKERSKEQEAFWEEHLRELYGNDISIQFKYKKCFFDLLHIPKKVIFECKLDLKNFNETQYKKYICALENFRVVYLIDKDCIVDIATKRVYTTNPVKYGFYIASIPSFTKTTYMDDLLLEFEVVGVEDIKNVVQHMV